MDEKRQHENREIDEATGGSEREQTGALPEAAVGQSESQPTGMGGPEEAGLDIGSNEDRTRGMSLDEQGERDTEIRRETQFRNSTATPLDPEAGGKKVTRDEDLFRREGEA